jgi:hypothetical protein
MNILDQILEYVKEKKTDLITSAEVKTALNKKHGTNPSSIILSDYCYNRYNTGIPFNKHVFRYVAKNLYEYLGEHFLYTGLIYHKPAGEKQEYIVGEWREGEKFMYENPVLEKDLEVISRDQIKKLYENYIDILQLELKLLQCKATELRHLVGRIGEFHCALTTNGKLSRTTNQHGFDVIANGRKISVKTTAQKSGFITFNKNTFSMCDDVFVVQYVDDNFSVLFSGPKEELENSCRDYRGNYELDLSKLIKRRKELV